MEHELFEALVLAEQYVQGCPKHVKEKIREAIEKYCSEEN